MYQAVDVKIKLTPYNYSNPPVKNDLLCCPWSCASTKILFLFVFPCWYAHSVLQQFFGRTTLPCVLMLFYSITVGLLPNMSVTVLNSCHLNSPDGKLETIRGYLYQPNPKEPGQMKIHLFFGMPEDETVGGDSDCKCICD